MGKNSKKKRRSRKNYVRAVEEAYGWLRALQIRYSAENRHECAKEVEQAYKNLWCECLPDPAPWV